MAKEKCDLSKLRQKRLKLLVIHERRCGEISPKAVVKFSTNDIGKTIQPAMAESNNAEDHEPSSMAAEVAHEAADINDVATGPVAVAPPTYAPPILRRVMNDRTYRALGRARNGRFKSMLDALCMIIRETHPSRSKWNLWMEAATPDANEAHLAIQCPAGIPQTAIAAIDKCMRTTLETMNQAHLAADNLVTGASSSKGGPRTKADRARRNKLNNEKKRARLKRKTAASRPQAGNSNTPGTT